MLKRSFLSLKSKVYGKTTHLEALDTSHDTNVSQLYITELALAVKHWVLDFWMTQLPLNKFSCRNLCSSYLVLQTVLRRALTHIATTSR